MSLDLDLFIYALLEECILILLHEFIAFGVLLILT